MTDQRFDPRPAPSGQFGEPHGQLREPSTQVQALIGESTRDWLRRLLGTDSDDALTRLRQYQRIASLDRVRSGVAEELRGLLSDVLVNAYSLRSTVDKSAHPPIEKILRAAGRAQGLISVLLCQNPDARLTRRPAANFDRLIGDAMFKFGNFLGDDVFLEIETDTEGWHLMPPATENGDLIEQALLNLVVNAVEALPDGGRVRVRTQVVGRDHPHVRDRDNVVDGSYLRLEVSDTGCGISRELLQRIFQPFYSTKRATRGAGLGLCLTYGIVEELGGHMSVKSLEGWGTAMRVYLPAERVRADASLGGE